MGAGEKSSDTKLYFIVGTGRVTKRAKTNNNYVAELLYISKGPGANFLRGHKKWKGKYIPYLHG
jgi:hypothetical protein